MTIKNIQKLMDNHVRLIKQVRKNRLEVYKFRLDLVDAAFDKISKIFRESSLIVKKDTILKTVIIKGEGTSDVLLNTFNYVMNNLKKMNCKIVSAKIRNLSNDYYLCVLKDGKVIFDVSKNR